MYIKRLLGLLFLLNSLSLDASIISSQSPWGCVPVWPIWRPHWQARSAYYDTVLNYTTKCGISWIRPNCAPGGEELRNNPAILDSFVTVINRHPVSLVWITDPGGDTQDTLIWERFWNAMVTRYGTGGNMPGFKRPVKYWEICNEPDGATRGGPYQIVDTTSLYVSAVSDSLENVEDRPWKRAICMPGVNFDTAFCEKLIKKELSYTCKYIRICANEIHSKDPSAKVVAPALCLCVGWQWYGGHPVWDVQCMSGGTPYIVRIAYKPMDFYWKWLIDSVGNCVDVVSLHYHYANPQDIIRDLDSLDKIINSLGGGNKPIFITETGWEVNKPYNANAIARYYQTYFNGLTKLSCFGKLKVFPFTLVDFVGEHWGLMDSTFTPRPAYYTMQKFIRSY